MYLPPVYLSAVSCAAVAAYTAVAQDLGSGIALRTEAMLHMSTTQLQTRDHLSAEYQYTIMQTRCPIMQTGMGTLCLYAKHATRSLTVSRVTTGTCFKVCMICHSSA